MKKKYKNLGEYLQIHNRHGGTTAAVRRLARTCKFKIIGNSNSHNYDRFLDEDDLLTFNNHEHLDFNGESITTGVIDGHHEGNTISIYDIYPILTVSNIDILKNINNIAVQINKLEEEKESLITQLKYLADNNKDTLTNDEFDEYVINNITGIELPEAVVETEELIEV
jgi:hypothetical protein